MLSSVHIFPKLHVMGWLSLLTSCEYIKCVVVYFQITKTFSENTCFLAVIGILEKYLQRRVFAILLFSATFASRYSKCTKYGRRKVLRTCVMLTLSWRRFQSYRNQSIDSQTKSMGWFLYDRDLRQQRVKGLCHTD